MDISKVGVVGCGLMGSGIAQVAAQAGFEVAVREAGPDLLEKGLARIRKSLDTAVARGKLPAEDAAAALGRIRGVTALEEFGDRDLVVEAVTESLAAKRVVFASLDAICPAQTILASNTSSLSITELAAFTRRPERFLGLHFFNPVPLMKLVEVVRTLRTAPQTVEAGVAFARALGKEPILAQDSPGFVVNLLLVPYLLDAVRALERGVAGAEDIDRAMRLGAGHPMGPLTLIDLVGLDTACSIADILFDAFRQPQYAAPTLLRRMAAAGYLGRKSGIGFYDYRVDPPQPTPGLVQTGEPHP